MLKEDKELQKQLSETLIRKVSDDEFIEMKKDYLINIVPSKKEK